jgi:hypothetical protein
MNNFDKYLSEYNISLICNDTFKTSVDYIKNFLLMNDLYMYNAFCYINQLSLNTELENNFIVHENIFIKYNLITNRDQIKNYIINKLNLIKNIDYIIINKYYFFREQVFINLMNTYKKYKINYEKILIYYDKYVIDFIEKYQYVII